MTTYEVYAKTDCVFCKKAIELLSLKKIPFIATFTDKNLDYLENKKKEWNWPTVPIILKSLNGEIKLVGGFSELEQSLNESSETSE